MPNRVREGLGCRWRGKAGVWRPQQAPRAVKPTASAHSHLFPQVFGELDAAELLKHAAEEVSLRAGREGAQAGRTGVMELARSLTLVLRPATTKSRL